MKIVATNSLTVSNVNDGTITHVAYANSADGADGFTTVYPNLNLLSDSKDFKNKNVAESLVTTSITSSYSAVMTENDTTFLRFSPADGGATDWFRAYMNRRTQSPNFPNVDIKGNTNYTFSVWLKGTGTHTIIAYDSWTNPVNARQNVTLTSDWKLYAFTVLSRPTADIPADKMVQFFIRSDTVGSEINLKYPKVEEGSTATPYIPSSSEVTTADWPSFIGQYSDFTATASTDPTKYAPWTVFKGIDGNNGRGIVSSEQKYQLTQTSAKPVDPWDTSVWQTTQPTTTATNKYLWSITRTTFNLAPLTQDIVEQKAVYGDTGKDGDPGKVVSDTEPSTRFKGLTWKYSGTAGLTASDGTVIKPNTEYYYNGSHWIINLIEANQLNVNDLSAISATFTNGTIENNWVTGTVTSDTIIERNQILINSSDSSTGDKNSLGLDNQQGFIMVYQNGSTGKTIQAGVNFQGFFMSDSEGASARLTPTGVYVSNGLQTTTVSLGSGINATLAKIGQMCQISINSNSSNVPAGNGVALSGNIPAGWRPAIGTPFEVMMYSGTAFQRPLHITIGTDGNLSIVNASASSYWCFGGTTYMLA